MERTRVEQAPLKKKPSGARVLTQVTEVPQLRGGPAGSPRELINGMEDALGAPATDWAGDHISPRRISYGPSGWVLPELTCRNLIPES